MWPPGETLDVEVQAGLTGADEARHLRRLAQALDLDLAGLVSLPLALAAIAAQAPGGAIVVDAGAGATTVAVALPRAGARAAVIPLGGADLEAEVACALRAELPTAREVLRAHAAGALREGGAKRRRTGRRERCAPRGAPRGNLGRRPGAGAGRPDRGTPPPRRPPPLWRRRGAPPS